MPYQFPYTNLHDLDLDWMLNQVKDAKDKVDSFTSEENYNNIVNNAVERVENSDQYQQTMTDVVAAGTAATEAANAAHEAAGRANSAAQTAEDVSDIVAEPFLTTKDYSEGWYVTYSGNLYKFITFHSAGAWNNEEVEPVTVGTQLTNANNDIDAVNKTTGVYIISWEQGRYTSTGAKTPSDTQIRTSEPIKVTAGDTIKCIGNAAIVYNCYFYNSGTYLSSLTNVLGGDSVVIPANANELCVSLRTATPVIEITPEYGKTVTVYNVNGDVPRISNYNSARKLALDYRDCAIIPNGTDYNSLTAPGNYTSPQTAEDIATMVNCPVTTGHTLYVSNIVSTQTILQIVTAIDNNPAVYYRIKRNSASSFSSWFLLANDSSVQSTVASAVATSEADILDMLGICEITWEQGRYNVSGAETASDTYIRTATPLNVTPGETFVPVFSGALLFAYYYDTNDNFLSVMDSNTGTPFTIPASTAFMRIAFRNAPAIEITTDYGKNLKLYKADGYIMKPLYKPFNEPMLTIIDDDTNERFYTDLFGVFQNKNVPIATAVITGRVGNSGYMTWTQIEECSSNGFEVLSHTNRHFLSTDTDFETLTVDDIAKDYLKAKNILGMHGFNTNLLVFSGSTGLYTKFQTAAQRVYRGAFLAGDNVTNGQDANNYKIQRYRIGNQTDYHCDLDVLKGLIDNVLSTGGWMVWMLHTSGGASAWTPGTEEGSSAYILGQAVDYAIAQGLPIVTAEYGFRKYIEGK